MSSEVFPALRISPAEYESSEWFDTAIQRARDGSELRIDFGGGGSRWDFAVTTVGAERQTLVDFFKARRGRWDTYYFIDPEDEGEPPTQHLVRFDQDALAGRKEPTSPGQPDVYKYRISLVTVVTS